MKKKTVDYILTVAGLLIAGTGLYLVKSIADPRGFLLALPFVLIGVGCGMFGHGMGDLISIRALKNSPDIQKQLQIERQDERNVAIANRAKAKAFDVMTFVFGALMLTFALMKVELTAVLLLVFAYLLVEGYSVFYLVKYQKEM